MANSDIVSSLMFEWQTLEPNEIDRLCAQLHKKIQRWVARHHPDAKLRAHLLRLTGVTIGESANIGRGVLIEDSYQKLVTIGEHAVVHDNTMLLAGAGPNNSHLANFPYVRDHLIVEKPISIGAFAVLEERAIVMPGVQIGDHAIVRARAVVTKNVASHTVVAGAPAKENP